MNSTKEITPMKSKTSTLLYKTSIRKIWWEKLPKKINFLNKKNLLMNSFKKNSSSTLTSTLRTLTLTRMNINHLSIKAIIYQEWMIREPAFIKNNPNNNKIDLILLIRYLNRNTLTHNKKIKITILKIIIFIKEQEGATTITKIFIRINRYMLIEKLNIQRSAKLNKFQN